MIHLLHIDLFWAAKIFKHWHCCRSFSWRSEDERAWTMIMCLIRKGSICFFIQHHLQLFHFQPSALLTNNM